MINTKDKNPFSALTDREKEILALMLKGALVKEISSTLSLKSNTISTYKKLIFYKTGVENSIELFKLAQKYQIVK
jgi:two-component system invasion response regulator UvrY